MALEPGVGARGALVRRPLLSLEFPALYRAHFGWVVQTLRRLGASATELEDLAHDVFVAVYRHLGDYDPARPMRPWLFGFIYRVVLDHRKTSRRREVAVDSKVDASRAPERVDQGPTPEQVLEQRRLRERLYSALDAMDFEKRSLVVMHELEGLTAPHIAGVLEIPVNTAYSRLRLARAELEKHLQRLGGGSHGE